MKHPRIHLLLGCLLMALVSCNRVTPASAVAYNDAIVDVQSRVVGYFDQFVMAADTGDSLSAVKALTTALDSARGGQQRLEAMEPFDGSTTLRDAAVNLVKHYVQGLDHDWREIVGVLTNHNATMEQLEQANQVRDDFSIEEDKLFKEVEKAQQEMATKYKFDFKD
ncbi:MAG: hypothetical protein U0176_12490 [Bacteroidia bacterium]